MSRGLARLSVPPPLLPEQSNVANPTLSMTWMWLSQAPSGSRVDSVPLIFLRLSCLTFAFSHTSNKAYLTDVQHSLRGSRRPSGTGSPHSSPRFSLRGVFSASSGPTSVLPPPRLPASSQRAGSMAPDYRILLSKHAPHIAQTKCSAASSGSMSHH